MELILKRCKEILNRLSVYVVRSKKTIKAPAESHFLKTVFFVVSSMALTLGGILLFSIAFVLKVFFGALIIWRGYNFDVKVEYFSSIEVAVAQISSLLRFGKIISLIFTPFVAVLHALSNIKLDLSYLGITCSGSQAPFELLLDCLILGFVIIVIDSEFHIYSGISFVGVLRSFISTSLMPGFEESISWGTPVKFFYIILSGFCLGVAYLSPLQSTLRCKYPTPLHPTPPHPS